MNDVCQWRAFLPLWGRAAIIRGVVARRSASICEATAARRVWGYKLCSTHADGVDAACHKALAKSQ